MHCVHCGNAFSPNTQYCPNDGYLLRKNQGKTAVQAHQASHCRSCGTSLSNQENYCTDCGTSSYTQKIQTSKTSGTTHEKRQAAMSDQVNFQELSNISSWMSHLKPAGILAGVSVIFVFILSLIVSNRIASAVQTGDPMMDAFIEPQLLNTLLILHTVPFSFWGEALDFFGGSMSMSFRIGLIIAILLVGLMLMIAGFIVSKFQASMSQLSLIQTTLLGAAFYGLFLAILSLFVSQSHGGSMGDFSMEVSFSFSFFASLFFGFILFTFFTFLGASIEKRVTSGVSSSDNVSFPIKLSVIAFSISFAVILLFTTIYAWNSEAITELREFEGSGLAFLIATQFAAYMVSLAHFSPFQLNIFGIEEHAKSIWLFSSESRNEMLAELGLARFDIPLMMMFLVPIAIFVLLGRKLKEVYRSENIQALLIASVTYAVCMGTFAMLTKVELSGGLGILGGGLDGNISAGFPIIRTFIISFLFAAIFTFVGMKTLNVEGEK
ncbi:hypothetical protein LGQ02_18395 [Bacillus shivajii]|uniref:hypothetical protein n=1 Tax=Bacillus shivajii TaxID=1983719 RepID=UPI001CFC393C|nr:hypothetical protein [Bacillus shivajii]UCZ52730.1 hypothetical protein LGQ02_18395 [Bacillus shivajii]